jgi:hypothetical protein
LAGLQQARVKAAKRRFSAVGDDVEPPARAVPIQQKSERAVVPVAPVSAAIDAASATTAVNDALAAGDLAHAGELAMSLLASQEAAGEPAAQAGLQVIAAYQAAFEKLPPLHKISRSKISFDDRVAACFEEMLALLRIQDSQIAELQAMVSDLV